MRKRTAYSMRFSILGFTILLLLSTLLVNTARAEPCAILHVSLPAGTYIGLNSDPWLNEGWLLNLTGESQTFTVRINNTSASKRSYNTLIIIALNEAGYTNLQTLIVYGITVPRSSFTYGTPRPYNLWTWPSGDVYPTWYSTYVNVGTIDRKGYKDISVSVTFSDATDVRMHFDAYGSTVSGTPTSSGYITHNPLSADSTVLFQAGPPPLQPPIADFFYYPSYPETYETVTFNASESYDPDGYIVSYTWDFGDGTPIVVENDPITSHSYTAYGDYTVTLTVTDDDGLSDDSTLVVNVRQGPVADFNFTPIDPLEHETVTFDASASTPDGGVLISYTWNFGDGNITTVTTPIITHTYSTFGIYTVTLNVTDSEGKWDTETKPITVERLPMADFWWSPLNPVVCEDVTFDSSISTPDGGILISYAWDFGDGTPIVVEGDPITTHHYTANGTFTVTLNVTDSEGRWDTESKLITVSPRQWYLTVKTDPEGITTIPGEGWYINGTDVSLTAPATVSVSTDTRYRFSYWDVDGVSQGIDNNPITVHMDANHTATAHYVCQYYLTMSTNFGTVSPGNGWHDAGSVVSISATPPFMSTVSGERYVWNGWTGTGSGSYSGMNNPASINMNAPISEAASWTHQYLLTMATNHGTTTPSAGEHWYNAGTVVEISATPPSTVAGERYVWNGWTGTGLGSYSGSNNPASVTMNAPITETASWSHEYRLTMATNFGTTTPSMGEHWYTAGSALDISATAPGTVTGERYVWNGWTGTGTGSYTGPNNPASITMNGPIIETASWTHQYYLTLATNPSGITTPSGGGWFDSGTYAPISTTGLIEIIPGSSQYKFNGWTTADMSEITNPASPSTTVLMDQPKTVTANYKIQYYLTVTSAFDAPTPISGWFDGGTVITASVTSPELGPTGTRHVCTGWSGTGSLPPSGSSTSVTFTINAPSSITWNWKTQHYLKVKTDPSGIATIPGEGWYDESTSAPLNAPSVYGYEFLYWDVDYVQKEYGVRSISVTMDAPHTATAHYRQEQPQAVGGTTVSMKSPFLHTWVSLNAMLVAAIFATAFWVKKRQKETS